MKLIFQLSSLLWLLISCHNRIQTDPLEIINRSIQVHGGDKISHSIIKFDVRDRHYIASLQNGIFQYERIFTDSADIVHDILTNNGFTRMINEDTIQVGKDWFLRYSNSINSVIYFALLPYGLNDSAVRKKYIGLCEINDKQYYKIQVTFDKESGGDDYQDIFIYWINTDTYSMDYLAYKYLTDGGGMRFRSVQGINIVKGIRFQDYKNYKPKTLKYKLSNLDSLYILRQLDLLSTIQIENITVELIEKKD